MAGPDRTAPGEDGRSCAKGRVSVPGQIASGIDALATRYGLGAEAKSKLTRLLRLLAYDPLAPTAIRKERAVLEDHLADSLVALECEEMASAGQVLDLGAGAGLPGLPLAIAMPGTCFTLLESASRKCRFLARALAELGLANAAIACARAESFQTGLNSHDVVLVRAVASLPVIAEYAAPLLRVGGSVLAWRGRRDREGEADLTAAAAALGLGEPAIRAVQPYPGTEHRHLYALKKVRDTPSGFPRRPGMALKRPLGAETLRERAPSDRIQR